MVGIEPTLKVLETLVLPLYDTDIGGEYWNRTNSTLRLYGLANRCITILPTLHIYGAFSRNRTASSGSSDQRTHQLYQEGLVPRDGFEPTLYSLKGRLPRPLEEHGILVELTGFEPVISAVRGQRPKPLDESSITCQRTLAEACDDSLHASDRLCIGTVPRTRILHSQDDSL